MFLRIFPYFFLIPVFLFGGGFELQKGSQTPEDQKRLGFFSALFEVASKREKPLEAIPKILHFIWLGPKPFPQESAVRIKEWIDRHPGWKALFWTDYAHKLPDTRMELRTLQNFPLGDLKECYYLCDNFGERSELLRYAILENQGGIYVDHDVECLKTLAPLQEGYDFFCGIEPVASSGLSSSVNPSPHLLAATPSHPILQGTIQWLIREWNRLESQYPGTDSSALFNRVRHRTFRALSMGIIQGHSRSGRRDIVFPPDYFSLAEKAHALYAAHQHRGSWYKKEAESEQKIQHLFHDAVREVDHTFLLALALTGVNVIFCAFLLFGRKKILPLFLLCLGIAGPLSAEESDFDELMGKYTAHWRHVAQAGDAKMLECVKVLYEKNKAAQFTQEGPYKIPPVVHFIWLGPRTFPPESVENVRTWIAQNPGWKVKFWTDRDREVPCEGMEKILISDFHFLKLGKCYEESQNWGEKSDVLRYEILFQQGGVYADHDANCLRPFDGMHRGYDFFCCLETPHEAFVGRNVTCGNGVLGSRPGHPTIGRVIDLIHDRWRNLGEKFRGRDEYSQIEVVMQRTYIALTDAFPETIDKNGNVDIVLPAAYFFSKSGIPSLYSQHFYATAWDAFKGRKSEFERLGEKSLGKIRRKNKNLTYVIEGLIALNGLLLIFCLLKRYVSAKKRMRIPNHGKT